MWDCIIACVFRKGEICLFCHEILPLELAENVIVLICNPSVVQMIWSVNGFLRFLGASK